MSNKRSSGMREISVDSIDLDNNEVYESVSRGVRYVLPPLRAMTSKLTIPPSQALYPSAFPITLMVLRPGSVLVYLLPPRLNHWMIPPVFIHFPMAIIEQIRMEPSMLMMRL
jgi:hypothetical protein